MLQVLRKRVIKMQQRILGKSGEGCRKEKVSMVENTPPFTVSSTQTCFEKGNFCVEEGLVTSCFIC